MDSEDYDCLFRIVMVGDSGVGKTNLLGRYVVNEFSFETKTTIGAQFSQKFLNFDSKTIQAQIWDTAGQERFNSITQTYFRGAVGALLLYDICSSQSFQNVEKWMKSLKELAEPDVVIVLVGNKSDLVNLRQVSIEEGQVFAQKHNLEFIETSALKGENVTIAFENLIKKIYFLMNEKNKKTESYKFVGIIPKKYTEPEKISHKLVAPKRKNKTKGCCSK